MSKYSDKKAGKKVNSLQGLAAVVAPEMRHDVTDVVAQVMGACAPLVEKYEAVATIRGEAEALMAEAKRIMSAPEFAEAEQLAQLNRDCLEEVEATIKGIERDTFATEAIKDLLNKAYREGKRPVVEAQVKTAAKIAGEKLAANALQTHEECVKRLAELQAITVPLREEADRYGLKAREKFAEVKKLEAKEVVLAS